jgi:hypothetical protein
VLEFAGVEETCGVPGPVGAGVGTEDGGAGIEMSWGDGGRMCAGRLGIWMRFAMLWYDAGMICKWDAELSGQGFCYRR